MQILWLFKNNFISVCDGCFISHNQLKTFSYLDVWWSCIIYCNKFCMYWYLKRTDNLQEGSFDISPQLNGKILCVQGAVEIRRRKDRTWEISAEGELSGSRWAAGMQRLHYKVSIVCCLCKMAFIFHSYDFNCFIYGNLSIVALMCIFTVVGSSMDDSNTGWISSSFSWYARDYRRTGQQMSWRSNIAVVLSRSTGVPVRSYPFQHGCCSAPFYRRSCPFLSVPTWLLFCPVLQAFLSVPVRSNTVVVLPRSTGVPVRSCPFLSVPTWLVFCPVLQAFLSIPVRSNMAVILSRSTGVPVRSCPFLSVPTQLLFCPVPQAFLSELYVYLVDQMHVGLGKVLSMEDQGPIPEPLTDLYQLKMFAREAEVNENFELAAKYYQEVSWTAPYLTTGILLLLLLLLFSFI